MMNGSNSIPIFCRDVETDFRRKTVAMKYLIVTFDKKWIETEHISF